MKKTLVINLIGGPGVGKSTTAALVFAKLKVLGYDCELITEFAKDCVWEERTETFKDQIYLFAKQQHRIYRCKGKIDVVITDSPLILNTYYGADNPELVNLTLSEFKKYWNMNFVLKRNKPYNPNGRNQTEDEAKNIDVVLEEKLKEYNIPYATLCNCDNVTMADLIVQDVIAELKKNS